jgi:hypothetical protein
MALDAGKMVQQIGRPQAEHLSHAGQMVAGMSQPLLDAARESAANASAIISGFGSWPGCFFPPDAERIYDRSFAHFAQLVADGEIGSVT